MFVVYSILLVCEIVTILIKNGKSASSLVNIAKYISNIYWCIVFFSLPTYLFLPVSINIIHVPSRTTTFYSQVYNIRMLAIEIPITNCYDFLTSSKSILSMELNFVILCYDIPRQNMSFLHSVVSLRFIAFISVII